MIDEEDHTKLRPMVAGDRIYIVTVTTLRVQHIFWSLYQRLNSLQAMEELGSWSFIQHSDG